MTMITRLIISTDRLQFAISRITQIWKIHSNVIAVRFCFWVRNTYESMKLFFNPKTVKTIIVKVTESGSVFRTAGDNSDWQLLTSTVEHDLQPLRRGKKDSYEFLDFDDEIEDFLTERYGLVNKAYRLYTFNIGHIHFVCHRTLNECGEPFLEVHADLPRKILKDILWELSIECNETEHEDWED